MDYSYRLPRLFRDVDELVERQKKLERYIQHLQQQKGESTTKLEQRISDQERRIEALKEKIEYMTNENVKLKEQINKLTEVVEYLATKQKREQDLML